MTAMKRYVCGVDIGTSTLKITLLSDDGSTVGPFKRELVTDYPKPLYAQQDPMQWFEAFREVLQEAFITGVRAEQIVAILPDAATHTTVLLDEYFAPVRPAIMWNDQRSAVLAERYAEKDRVFHLTNHYPGSMWSLFQALWVKENEPEAWRRVKYLLFAKDFFRWQLTGRYCTDHIDAEGSQFYDVHEKKWSDELCVLLDFQSERLPELCDASDVAGGLTKEAARSLGLLEGTSVFVGTTDTALEMVACGAIHRGQATVKLATSGRICVVAGRAYPHLQLVNYSHVVKGSYYPGTGTRSCATSLRWFRDSFSHGQTFSSLSEQAAAVPPGSDGLIYHPYLLGEFTPYSNDKLRASFTGMSMNHTAGHFVRAIMEGTAYSLRECMELLISLGVEIGSEPLLLIGGGGESELWAGILADVLERTVEIPANIDSSFGGALLAGVSIGMFANLEEAVSRACRKERAIRPNEENVRVYRWSFNKYRDLVRALLPIYEKYDC